MGVAAPSIQAEMADWVRMGGGNSGIVGNPATHDSGFHMAANEVGPDDYSRRRDPNGPDGPFDNWGWSCAGDFSHKRKEELRAKHRALLARLLDGDPSLSMICEFIGQPWADRPVKYWARWRGATNLANYTGVGHDHWSHISWYRSRASERAYLWVPRPVPQYPTIGAEVTEELAKKMVICRRDTAHAHVRRLQAVLNGVFGFSLTVDGDYGPVTESAVRKWQVRVGLEATGVFGLREWWILLTASSAGMPAAR